MTADIETSDGWLAYLELRKAKNARAPFTATARRRILIKLQDWQSQGVDVQAVLFASVENGWTGVFLPKTEPGHGAQAQSFRQRDADAASQRVAEFTGGLVSRRPMRDEDLFRDLPRLEQ